MNFRCYKCGCTETETIPWPFGPHAAKVVCGYCGHFLWWKKRPTEREWTDNTPMPFGKDKGVEMIDLMPSYMLWLRKQDWVAEKFPALKDYLDAHAEEFQRALKWEKLTGYRGPAKQGEDMEPTLVIEKQKRACPVCFAPLKHYRDFIGEGTLYEESFECSGCGYSYEFSCGAYRARVGEREWVWSHNTKEGEPRDEIRAEIERARKEAHGIAG